MTLPETYIFSTKIHCLPFIQCINQIGIAVRHNEKLLVFPMNIHILTELSRNLEFREIHNRSGIIFADGMPLVWMSHLTKKIIPERVSGTLLVETVLKKFSGVYLIGSNPDTLHKMKETYNTHNKNRVVGFYSPPHKDDWGGKVNNLIMREINQVGAKIVLVGVGPLKQERWILKYAPKSEARVFIAVGSAFDILSGNIPRAPGWMQYLGMEWMWRILFEPKRLMPRYINDGWILSKMIFRHLLQNKKILL